ncbi:hypothetical protein PMIN06_007580 [Paraphaeosphaeria minitans]
MFVKKLLAGERPSGSGRYFRNDNTQVHHHFKDSIYLPNISDNFCIRTRGLFERAQTSQEVTSNASPSYHNDIKKLPVQVIEPWEGEFDWESNANHVSSFNAELDKKTTYVLAHHGFYCAPSSLSLLRLLTGAHQVPLGSARKSLLHLAVRIKGKTGGGNCASISSQLIPIR